MPRISEFYGIVIQMYRRGEHPPPHFHVRYSGRRATVDIRTREVLEAKGKLPPRVIRLVRKWAKRHEGELLDNWERARRHQPPARIEPLP